MIIHDDDDVDDPTSGEGTVPGAWGGGPFAPGTMLPALLRGTSWPVSATRAPRSTLLWREALRLP